MTTYRRFVNAELCAQGAVRTAPHIGTAIKSVWELVPAEESDQASPLGGGPAASSHPVPLAGQPEHSALVVRRAAQLVSRSLGSCAPTSINVICRRRRSAAPSSTESHRIERCPFGACRSAVHLAPPGPRERP